MAFSLGQPRSVQLRQGAAEREGVAGTPQLIPFMIHIRL